MPRNHDIDPREITLAHLERERAEWLPAYRRAERAGRMNGVANAEAAALFEPIDKLLDELNELGSIAVSQSLESETS